MASKIVGKKNKRSYDDKLIKWISIGLGAFVAIVVAIVIIVSVVTGYIAKVDGLKIYDYEYVYFLQQAMYEEQNEKFEEPEDYDKMTSDEKKELIRKFWTDERKADCVEEAMDKARQFKAQYRLARAAGYKLTSEQKANVKANINNSYNMYKNYYKLSDEMIKLYYFGGMTLSEYKDFAIIQSTIELYKEALKKTYNATEEDLRAIYDKDPDDYRMVTIRQFTIKVDKTKPTDEKAEDYQTKLDEYKKAYDEALKEAKEIADTYNNGKTMTIYKVNDKGEFVLDDKGNKVVEKENVSFIDYIKSMSDESSSSKTNGELKINNNNKGSVKELTDFALSMVWNEDRTLIVKKPVENDEDSSDKKDDSGTEAQADEKDKDDKDDEDDKEDKDKEKQMTKLEIVETEQYIYVVRAEDITDYENSVESTEGAKDSIKDKIEYKWLEDKAVEDLESKVNSKGDEYKIYGKKDDDIKKINDSLFSTI